MPLKRLKIAKQIVASTPDVTCEGCDEGIGWCSSGRPCWPTPDEAARLLEAGHAGKLMLDWWASDGGVDFYVLSPAARGYEGKIAPGLRSSELGFYEQLGVLGVLMANLHQSIGMAELNNGCTFLSEENLCQLHDPGLKPAEGRKTCCKLGKQEDLHKAIARLWNTPAGRKVVSKWRALTGCQDEG